MLFFEYASHCNTMLWFLLIFKELLILNFDTSHVLYHAHEIIMNSLAT